MKFATAASGWVLRSSIGLVAACATPAAPRDDAGPDARTDAAPGDAADASRADVAALDVAELDAAAPDASGRDGSPRDVATDTARADASPTDAPSGADARDAGPVSDVARDTGSAPPDAGAATMKVGVNGGGWGAGEAADEQPAVDSVRVDASSVSDISGYVSRAMPVIVDFSGPYNTGGVSALNAATWTSNAVSYYASTCGGLRARCPAIEVLNEPYGAWFWGSSAASAANEAAYARLIRAAHDAFAARFGADAPAILASFDDPAWWNGMLAADASLGSVVDGVVVHPYGGTGSVASSALGNRTLVMTAHATTGKPIWITEVGWPTAVGRPATGDSLQWSESDQADNVYNFVNWARSTGYVSAVMIFGYRDYGTNDWYGIERWGEAGATVNGSRKPAYRALYCAAHGLPESC